LGPSWRLALVPSSFLALVPVRSWLTRGLASSFLVRSWLLNFVFSVSVRRTKSGICKMLLTRESPI
jgi:hypothetical protein